MNSFLDLFLSSTPWAECNPAWFSADWSTRRYARLTNGMGQTAILMESPPDHDPRSMIGHQIGAWVTVDTHLRRLGLNAPHIIAKDTDNGYILMEDFGNESLIGKGTDAYHAAIDALITMRDHPLATDDIDLIPYRNTHVYRALRFYPAYVLKKPDLEEVWFVAWKTVETALPPCPQILTHIDFGPMNLMWLPDRQGTDRIGILDFQAACIGPFVYDIVNLLDDARREIPADMKQSCLDRYCAALSPETTAIFNAWYPVIAAQFHARILGQILKLKAENGRDDLMQYYTPLTKRFEKELQHPALAPILRLIEQER